MLLQHKHQREHANPRANQLKTEPSYVRNGHAAPLDASAEGNAGRRLPEGQSTRPRLPPGTSRSSAAAGCGVSVRLLSPGTRDCVEPAQRKAGQRTDRSRRRRAARISASATLSSSSAYSWVVSVLAWPRRPPTASLDTPELISSVAWALRSWWIFIPTPAPPHQPSHHSSSPSSHNRP